MNNWDKIWIKKGKEETNNLNILNGFNVNNINYKTKDLVNYIIKICGIKKKDSILEIGAGAGRLGKFFLEKNYNYNAIEKSYSLVNKFKLLVNKDKIKHSSGENIPYQDNSYDIVFCWSVVQYLNNISQFKIFMNEMVRVSKRVIFIGDVYEQLENVDNKNYTYKLSNLKHLNIPKKYFYNKKNINITLDIKSCYIEKKYNSSPTRYNVILNIDKSIKHLTILKQFFSKKDIENIKKEIEFLEKQSDKKNYIRKYYEYQNEDILSRIEYFVNYSKIMKNISNIFFNNQKYILMKDKINFKYPDGEGFKPHQDITSGWRKYGKKHFTVAIPIVDTYIKNGCLWFADINCDKMLTKEFTDLDYSIVEKNLYKPIITSIGDIIIFDSYIPHKSFINMTDKKRIILFFTYVLIDNDNIKDDIYECYHEDKFKSVPPNIYRDKDLNIKYRSGNTNAKR